MIFRFLFLISTLLFTFISVNAQESEYEIGRPSELRGLTRIYIDTQADLKDYERLESELLKAKIPGIKIVEDSSDADIVIVYKGLVFDGAYVGSAARNRNVTTASVRAIPMISGEALVFINSPGKPRLVMRYNNKQESQWEQKPTTKFIREFVKVYKKANETK